MHPKQAEEVRRLRDQSKRIANGELLPDVVTLLRGRLPQLGKNLFLIEEIVEQGEDIYVFVVDCEQVVAVEISRHGGPTEVSVTSVEEYRRRLSGKSKNRMIDAIRVVMQELQGKPHD